MTAAAEDKSALLEEQISRVARFPTANELWKLHGALLACTRGQPDAELTLKVAREFYVYLSELQSKMTSRQYNELASRLDIASVGVLALQDILIEQENLGKSLLLGSIGEGLMILASRQYVKAWEQELKAVHRNAAWTLYDVLWHLSRHYQPDLAATERLALIEATLAPALDDNAPFETRLLLLLRLFQVSLLLQIARLCAPTARQT
jgi:hypothetical protein